MSTLALTRGRVALVDPDDLDLLMELGGWTVHTQTGYVFRSYMDPSGERRADGIRVKRKRMWIHRLLMGLAPDDPLKVDHRNLDKLDNRRGNLRIVTDAQNAQNKASDGFRGVSAHKASGKWEAYAQLDGKKHHLGLYLSPEKASEVAAAWREINMPWSVT